MTSYKHVRFFNFVQLAGYQTREYQATRNDAPQQNSGDNTAVRRRKRKRLIDMKHDDQDRSATADKKAPASTKRRERRTRLIDLKHENRAKRRQKHQQGWPPNKNIYNVHER